MYTINKPNKTTIEIKISTTPQEWQDAVSKVYEKTKNKYSVQGFRKGHVPQKVIEKTYGEAVFFEDAFADLAEDAYRKVLSEDDTIHPFGEPSLKLDKFVEGKLEGTLTLTVIPPVKLGKYKGLKVNAHLMEFDDHMVDDELEHARQENVKLEPKDGASKMGDVVTIDFKGSVDGVPFDGGTATDYDLHLGSKTFIDNFEEQLVGKKAGEKVDVNVTFPKNYNVSSLAGKKALFECTVKAVKSRTLPKLDDALAKEVADVDTVDAWRKEIKDALVNQIEKQNRTICEDAIVDAVVKSSEIDLPEQVIEKQLDDVMQDLNYRLAYQGLSLEDYAKYQGITMDELRKQRRADAERIAKMRQVLEEIVRAEKFEVSDAEIDAKLEEFAKMENKSLEEYKKTMEQRRLDYVYSDILMNKVMDMLTSQNTVVNKVESTKDKKCECGDDCNCGDDAHDCNCDDDCECKGKKVKKTAKKSTTKSAKTSTTKSTVKKSATTKSKKTTK